MDKRNLLLAFVLMMIVAVAPSIIWPTKKPAARPAGPTADSAKVSSDEVDSLQAVRPSARPTVATVTSSDTGRIVSGASPLYRLRFSRKGSRRGSAELLQYKSFAPGDSGAPVQLVPHGDAFLHHRLVLPSGDTVSLADWSFQPAGPPDAPSVVVNAGQGAKLRFDADRGGSHVTLEY